MTDKDTPGFRQRLEYHGVALAAWVARLLPFWVLRPIADLLGVIACWIDSRGRQVASANLEVAFPGISESEKKRITRESYQSFARTILELVWAPRLTPEVFLQHATVEGLDLNASAPDEPTIYVCLHASNFEWLSLALSYAVGPGIVVTQDFKNPLLGGLFDELRSSTGHTVIPQERAMIRMLKHLKAGGYFAMVIDLNLDPRESSVIIDQFDGLKTCVTQMHTALARHTKARLVPAECHPQADGSYRLVYHEAIPFAAEDSPEHVAQLCWDRLEPYVRAHPEYWLWSYKHWRFKPEGEAGQGYPYYANSAKRFEKMLKEHQAPVEA
ncbi:lysophospholipid acyltransferase family protein [soil metagenome]